MVTQYIPDRLIVILLISLASLAGPVYAAQPDNIVLAQATSPQPAAAPTPQERAEMLRQWLQASQQQLRKYQWLETTVVTVNGEQKSSTEMNCYYDVTGALQKVAVSGDSSTGGSGGPLLRAIKDDKKKQMTEYVQSAVTLLHEYIPPNADTIQQAVGAGNSGLKILEPGQQVELQFSNYIKPGDMLGVDIDLPTNRLLGMKVNSYLEDTSDAINLNVTMGVLPDGTIYTEQTTLSAPSKNLMVTVTNTGYRLGGS